MNNQTNCKFCNSNKLNILYHVAECFNCGVLLYYPYPEDDDVLYSKGRDERKDNIGVGDKEEIQKRQLEYYLKSESRNHNNFTKMINFTVPKNFKNKTVDILDFGGGGGQFACVFKSLVPLSNIYITDLYDEKLLDAYRNFNFQIQYNDFKKNDLKFDYIFLNDVFEHVSNPKELLILLKKKLKNKNSLIFIDTPKKFWIYNLCKMFSKNGIYKKLLKGSVTKDHLQVWTKKSFFNVIESSGFKIEKYKEVNEFTLPYDFYLDAMSISNPIIRYLAFIFYVTAPWTSTNKIMSVIKIVDEDIQ